VYVNRTIQNAINYSIKLYEYCENVRAKCRHDGSLRPKLSPIGFHYNHGAKVILITFGKILMIPSLVNSLISRPLETGNAPVARTCNNQELFSHANAVEQFKIRPRERAYSTHKKSSSNRKTSHSLSFSVTRKFRDARLKITETRVSAHAKATENPWPHYGDFQCIACLLHVAWRNPYAYIRARVQSTEKRAGEKMPQNAAKIACAWSRGKQYTFLENRTNYRARFYVLFRTRRSGRKFNITRPLRASVCAKSDREARIVGRISRFGCGHAGKSPPSRQLRGFPSSSGSVSIR